MTISPSLATRLTFVKNESQGMTKDLEASSSTVLLMLGLKV